METSLIILKPDTVERSLIGEVISRIEKKGLKIVGLKMAQLDDFIINEHYAHLTEKPFFPSIRDYMKRTPVVIIAVKGRNAVSAVRTFIGATNPSEALMGTIRGDFALSVDGNIIHASDSAETAEIELKRFFGGKDLFEYKKVTDEVM